MTALKETDEVAFSFDLLWACVKINLVYAEELVDSLPLMSTIFPSYTRPLKDDDDDV